jgi:hypothetical protein
VVTKSGLTSNKFRTRIKVIKKYFGEEAFSEFWIRVQKVEIQQNGGFSWKKVSD